MPELVSIASLLEGCCGLNFDTQFYVFLSLLMVHATVELLSVFYTVFATLFIISIVVI